MTACVGQQAISGKRVPNGFLNRSLPYFRHYCEYFSQGKSNCLAYCFGTDKPCVYFQLNFQLLKDLCKIVFVLGLLLQNFFFTQWADVKV